MATTRLTSKGMARAPYHLYARARVCRCVLPPQPFGTFRTLPRAVDVATGYWNVMVAFYGDQIFWLHWDVVDIRDGVVVWSDGRLTRGDENG